MTPQAPLIRLGDETPGDCWRSCIASLIERPSADVPHFIVECGGEDFVAYTRRWLQSQGFNLVEFTKPDNWTLADILKWVCGENPGVPLIVSGHPTNGAPFEGHSLIVIDGRIAHDPGACGLDGPSLCRDDEPGAARWWIHALCLDANWRSKRP